MDRPTPNETNDFDAFYVAADNAVPTIPSPDIRSSGRLRAVRQSGITISTSFAYSNEYRMRIFKNFHKIICSLKIIAQHSREWIHTKIGPFVQALSVIHIHPGNISATEWNYYFQPFKVALIKLIFDCSLRFDAETDESMRSEFLDLLQSLKSFYDCIAGITHTDVLYAKDVRLFTELTEQFSDLMPNIHDIIESVRGQYTMTLSQCNNDRDIANRLLRNNRVTELFETVSREHIPTFSYANVNHRKWFYEFALFMGIMKLHGPHTIERNIQDEIQNKGSRPNDAAKHCIAKEVGDEHFSVIDEAMRLYFFRMYDQAGSFSIGENLGPQGVTGQVFFGQDENRRATAVKVFFTKEGFEQELAIVNLIGSRHHPHIMRVYEHGRVGLDHFIASEFAESGTLSDIIHIIRNNRKKSDHPLSVANLTSEVVPVRLPLDMLISIYVSLLSALAHLHHQGIFHRDIGAKNIMIRGDNIKLADLGLAGKIDEGAEFLIQGTPRYLAPEIATLGYHTLGAGADLRMLATVMYHLATCKDPYVEILNRNNVRPPQVGSDAAARIGHILSTYRAYDIPFDDIIHFYPDASEAEKILLLLFVTQLKKIGARNPDKRGNDAFACLRSFATISREVFPIIPQLISNDTFTVSLPRKSLEILGVRARKNTFADTVSHHQPVNNHPVWKAFSLLVVPHVCNEIVAFLLEKKIIDNNNHSIILELTSLVWPSAQNILHVLSHHNVTFEKPGYITRIGHMTSLFSQEAEPQQRLPLVSSHNIFQTESLLRLGIFPKPIDDGVDMALPVDDI